MWARTVALWVMTLRAFASSRLQLHASGTHTQAGVCFTAKGLQGHCALHSGSCCSTAEETNRAPYAHRVVPCLVLRLWASYLRLRLASAASQLRQRECLWRSIKGHSLLQLVHISLQLLLALRQEVKRCCHCELPRWLPHKTKNFHRHILTQCLRACRSSSMETVGAAR